MVEVVKQIILSNPIDDNVKVDVKTNRKEFDFYIRLDNQTYKKIMLYINKVIQDDIVNYDNLVLNMLKLDLNLMLISEWFKKNG